MFRIFFIVNIDVYWFFIKFSGKLWFNVIKVRLFKIFTDIFTEKIFGKYEK